MAHHSPHCIANTHPVTCQSSLSGHLGLGLSALPNGIAAHQIHRSTCKRNQSSPSGTLSGEFDPLSEPPLPVLASLPPWSPPVGTVGDSALCSPSPLTGCTLMPWLCCRRDPLGCCLWWLRVCPGAYKAQDEGIRLDELTAEPQVQQDDAPGPSLTFVPYGKLFLKETFLEVQLCGSPMTHPAGCCSQRRHPRPPLRHAHQPWPRPGASAAAGPWRPPQHPPLLQPRPWPAPPHPAQHPAMLSALQQHPVTSLGHLVPSRGKAAASTPVPILGQTHLHALHWVVIEHALLVDSRLHNSASWHRRLQALLGIGRSRLIRRGAHELALHPRARLRELLAALVPDLLREAQRLALLLVLVQRLRWTQQP